MPMLVKKGSQSRTTPLRPSSEHAHLSSVPRPRKHRSGARRRALVALLTASCHLLQCTTTFAGDILRGGTPANQNRPRGNTPPTSAGADQARTNARDALARTTQAIQSVQALQSAARNLAARSVNNLVVDPRTGKQLPQVSDGLAPAHIVPLDPKLGIAGGIDLKNSTAGGLDLKTNSAATVLRGFDTKTGYDAGVASITQGKSVTGVNVTVKQKDPQAFLTWNTFNIGPKTTLFFDQSAGGVNSSQWIAFNKVGDPSGLPSQILGQIKALGQVYVMNLNGIIFGGTSQVNVHTLVASSLPINTNLTTRGLLNNPDGQFLFSALPVEKGRSTDPFVPTGVYSDPTKANYNMDGSPIDPTFRVGDVTVLPGATISSPTSASHVGGRVALIGANVNNSGVISTPDGQTILAAGLQVGMTAHSSKDPSLRGLNVYVGAVTDPASSLPSYSGAATNAGLILSPRADVTITGKTVNQNGIIDSSTSVSLNGRVDLIASYGATTNTAFDATNPDAGAQFLYNNTGTVTLGANSVIRILPEIASTDRVVGTQLALPSLVDIQGKVIHMAANSTILAPGANLATGANAVIPVSNTGKAFPSGVWLNSGVWVPGPSQADFIHTGGQVYLDSGAMINVAGTTDVEAPVTENILTLQLRGAEFSNSPLNRNNFNVRGVDLTIDIRRQGVFNGLAWVGTPLADATGFVGLIQRNAAELTTAGGTVNIATGGSVIMQKGSTIDVSGGWINYSGGVISTTRLIYRNNIFDISQATPDKIYDGVYTGQFSTTSSRWGVTKTYTSPFMLGTHYDPGYIYGQSGGGITISAPSVALDGDLKGNTLSGPRQRDLPAAPSSLSLTLQAQNPDRGTGFRSISINPPQIVFQSNTTQTAAKAFSQDAAGNLDTLSAERLGKVVLSPSLLTDSGFGSLTIYNPDGNVVLPAGESLLAQPKGSITVTAANVDIEGKVSAPGGTLDFKAYNLSPATYLALQQQGSAGGAVTPAASPTRGLITLGAAASLSTAGLVIDDRLSAPAPLSQPLVTTGGTVSLAGYSADLATGSVIDVSGGVVMDSFGKRTYGNAGSITINAGRDLELKGLLGGHLNLGSTLKGIAGIGAQGGSLNLQAMTIQVGGNVAPSANTLLLQPDFFNQGGFSSFALQAFGTINKAGTQFTPAVSIAPGTQITPTPQSYIAVSNGGAEESLRLVPENIPEGLRAPVSLTFTGLTVYDDFKTTLSARGDVVLGANAVVKVNANRLSSISFTGGTVAIYGSAFAPGGTIKVAGANAMPLGQAGLKGDTALTTVYLAAGSQLSTAGKVVLTPDAYGRTMGTVLPGGSISISGNIVAEAGSTLNVSGATGLLEVAPSSLGLTSTLDPLTGAPVVPVTSGLTTPLWSRNTVLTQIDSSGGLISLKGSEELFSHATLLGDAGGPTAAGGTLRIQSGAFYPEGAVAAGTDTNLLVTQSGSNIPGRFFAPGASALGRGVLDANGKAVKGQGYFAANDFLSGGFDSLSLGGNVAFSGPVTIDARANLSVATGGVLKADSTVNLSASFVALGKPLVGPQALSELTNAFTDATDKAVYFSPTFGTGRLNVTANTIEIGNLSLQGIGGARLIADNGDIRGDGTFDIAGDLYLRAAQIYPTTATSFTIAAYDYMSGGTNHAGSVTIARSGTKSLPLSAGGTLNIYASTINQGGVLRAPFGVINLGWDGTGTSPVDNGTGAGLGTVPGAPKLPIAQQINLLAGSVTSVSAIDPITGLGVIIPYGTSPDGKAWIDPAGNDITTAGPPVKAVNLSGVGIQTNKGSVIDIRGGGDLYAYRWVTGQTGTRDILASNNVFAVIPGYSSNYAPFAPFTGQATSLLGDPGYVNSTLKPGDRVYLDGGSGLRSGEYTLLPARYALLPGAFLVTPSSSAPIGNFLKPDGASFVNGYRFNDLNSGVDAPGLYSRFEVAPASTIATRAQYDSFFANSFLSNYAALHNLSTPPLPKDSGQLVFAASASMTLNGSVLSRSISGGLGSRVDISSPEDIEIASADVIAKLGAGGKANTLLLDSAQLTSIGAGSLLIGGVRKIGVDGSDVTVKTGNITVDNQGSALAGSDIILVANGTLKLNDGASVQQSGSVSGSSDKLVFGNASVAGSGRGVLLRVSGDSSTQIVRTNLDNPLSPNFTRDPSVNLIIGSGATINGNGVILDSTAGTKLSDTAVVTGKSLSFDSGQISLQLGSSPSNLYSSPTESATIGLVLSNSNLQAFKDATSLSLLSYSSIDVYGSGNVGSATLNNLALHAAQIRGFDVPSGSAATFTAKNILIDNRSNGTGLETKTAASGDLVLNASTIHVGTNKLSINQFENLTLNASAGLFFDGSGSLAADGSVTANTPIISAASSATQSITAGGALTFNSTPGTASVIRGLGANLALQGSSVTVNSDIVLPSGQLSITALTGDVVVGGKLDVSGTQKTFNDLVGYTSGGQITITSNNQSVNLTSSGSINVSAPTGGANAGSLTISATKGQMNIDAAFSLKGTAANGKGGSFGLDVSALGSLATINTLLNSSGFNESRSFRVRAGDVQVDGTAITHSFNLSADQGAINVTGTIDASGSTGGSIFLSAFKGLTLANGASLNVHANNGFDAAGKGGSVDLETRGDSGGVIDLQQGSSIDLTVNATAGLGQFSGTLHLRAPQFVNGAGIDLRVGKINGDILGASSITVEGYKVYDLSGRASGEITKADQNTVYADGVAFLGAQTSGDYTNYDKVLGRIEGASPAAGVASVLNLVNGAEFVRNGDLVLGNDGATRDPISNANPNGNAADWNLQTFRFGRHGAPGVLTMRATGNLVFSNGLTDGFDISAIENSSGGALSYNAPLLGQSSLLPANTQSWSYRLVAGADLSATDFRRVLSLDPSSANAVAANSGSLLLGKKSTGSANPDVNGNASTSTALKDSYQVIRTGSGDIDVSTARDVQLRNQFATIYTAGTQVADPTAGGTFTVPVLTSVTSPPSPVYQPQYSFGGGNVNISAQNDIIHYKFVGNNLVADSERELPNNWVQRRGLPTSWWVDFSNFFEGVGALGGGNVTMTAGRNVANVDAVIPTNARLLSDSTLVELGGGNLTVRAGGKLDAGVYYVERGHGTLSAGGVITTNNTRSPSIGALNGTAPLPSISWLPTTLFIGKSSFDVTAGGDLLLGPAANVFLLPEGLNNTVAYKTYFSTYSESASINVQSLGGNVTLRESAYAPASATTGALSTGAPENLLTTWIRNVQVFSKLNPSAYQPWLKINETAVTPFTTSSTIMPGTLEVTAFDGDINLAGNVTLAPSHQGELNLLAAGSVNGLQVTGAITNSGVRYDVWSTSRIIVSDADPALLPSVTAPKSYNSKTTNPTILADLNNAFSESGSTLGNYSVLQTKQALHDGSILHANDPEPVHVYGAGGDVSGITLFSPKETRVVAAQDITDIGLYLQNTTATGLSVVASGRDIIAYDANSALRGLARRPGNLINTSDTVLSGDIQINGPGALEVLAGRNLDLGVGLGNSDGTGVGLTSIGNGRNPALPFQGASIIAAAGIGSSFDLGSSGLNFDTFITQFVKGTNGARYLADYAAASGSSVSSVSAFTALPLEEQKRVALEIFFIVLRDTGRDHNLVGSTGFGNYTAGLAAVTALTSGVSPTGDITTQSRDIRTKSGGDISIIAPSGGLALATSVIGSPLAPPGIITESGGNISIMTKNNVDIGIARIFTLRGGNEIIWSSAGSIAAGSSSKTVQSAPPTRVIVDAQSADLKTDLAGLATGGGIGVLATVVGVAPGSVDLMAPSGSIDAGDAGIRATGNLNIAAPIVLNASNIVAGGSAAGAPGASAGGAPTVSAAPTAPPSNPAPPPQSAPQTSQNNTPPPAPIVQDLPSVISVEIIGFGGGDGSDDDLRKRKKEVPQ